MTKKPPRPSPSAHASEHKNKVRKGNDGKAYVSVADTNGVYRWRRAAAGASAKKATTTAASAGRGTKSRARRPAAQPAASRKALLAAKAKAEARLTALIDKHELGPLKKRILAAAWPCVIGSYRPAGKAKLPPGTTRIGGLPDMPAGFVWPTTTRKSSVKAKKTAARKQPVRRFPLSFIAQINCADVAPFDLTGVLPTLGLLSFFCDTEYLSNEADGVAVFYTPAGSTLTPAAAPPELAKEHVFEPVLIHKFRFKLSVPLRADEARAALFKGVRGDAWGLELDYESYIESADAKDGDAPIQLLGYPSYVQSGATSKKHTLLFYMSPPGNYGSEHKLGKLWPSDVFGDTGLLYYQISEADLRARRVKKAWGQTQCS